MGLLRNMRTGRKMFLVLALNICLLALMGWLGYSSSRSIQRELDGVFNRDFRGIELLLQADRDLHQMLIAERSMMLVPPGSKAYGQQLKDYEDNLGQADARVGKFRESALGDGQNKLVDGFFRDRKDWEEVSRQVLALTKAGSEDDLAKARELSLGKGKALFETMRGNIDQLTELVVDQGKAAQASAGEQFRSLTLNIVVLSLVSACIGALFTVLVARSLTGPLAKMLVFTRHVAAGEFGHTLDVAQRDEVGQLAASFSEMADSLAANLAEVKNKTIEAEHKAQEAQKATRKAEAATRQAQRARSEGMFQAAVRLEAIVERVSAASEEISNQSEEIRQGSEVQSERIASTATAMEEMNATVLEVARNSGEAASVGEDAKEKAVRGAEVVERSVEAMLATQRQTEELSKNMTLLGEQAQAIGSVMNVINDIADQTNLLALNAAIEAARAGEAGRGFAVVADEVRKLAEKTMAATKEVGDSIQAIQHAAQNNIKSMKASVEDMGKAVDLATESGEVLKEIVSSVENSASQIQSIATAAEEQSATSEEINRAIEEISRITMDTARGVAESAEALRELAQQAGALSGLIEELKAEGDGGVGNGRDGGRDDDGAAEGTA